MYLTTQRTSLILFIFMLLSCAERNVMYFQYKGKNCRATLIKRTMLNDSIFIECELDVRTIGNHCDTIKVSKGIWYIKECGEFRKYVDIYSKDTTYWYYPNCINTGKIVPLGTDTFDNKLVYKFQISPQHSDYFDPVFYFDPTIGWVRIMAPKVQCNDSRLVFLKYRKGKKMYDSALKAKIKANM